MPNGEFVRWEAPVGSVMRLWFAAPPFDNWAFAVRIDQSLYVIDTGTQGHAQSMIARFRERELRVDHILLTHHHETHTANAQALAEAFGATVWAHPESAPLCARLGVEIDRHFHPGERIGGLLEVIDAPGHAPGNVAFYWHPGRVMLAGDTVMGLGDSESRPFCLPGPHKGAPPSQVKEDARRLLSYEMDACLPAHGRHIVDQDPVPHIEAALA